MDISRKIFESGVVGAGGAGFPTHIKAQSTVEYLLANGAECEPLLHKDYELMVNFAPEVLMGMDLMRQSVSAKKTIVGIKAKNARAIEAIEKHIGESGIQICQLGDFYPSGDEYELVYSATGRLIPPAGIPLNVGCVVNNVETFYNISRAYEGVPVTEKLLTVTGAVRKPQTFFAPVGCSLEELIRFSGGTTVRDYSVFVSGVMMGSLTKDLSQSVTKTTAGIIVLPDDHFLVRRKGSSDGSKRRIGKSGCDQCSYCTELCPRYLLGYDVQPHKVMRSLVFTTSGAELWNQFAELCCACGLCSYYSCPEDLFPKEACDNAKQEMNKSGFKFRQTKAVKVHPMKEARRVPLRQLITRLNLNDYNVHTPFTASRPEAGRVVIPLKMHAGVPAEPVVKQGDTVRTGGLIARAPEGKLSANIHASIDGRVKSVTADAIEIAE